MTVLDLRESALTTRPAPTLGSAQRAAEAHLLARTVATPTAGATRTWPEPTSVDRAARRAIFALCSRVHGGELTIVDDGGRTTFGRLEADQWGRPPLRAEVVVHHPGAHRLVLREGSVGLGRAYLDGWFDTDDLTAALRLLSRSVRQYDPIRNRIQSAVGPVTDNLRRLRRQDKAQDRADIRAHYDLGNDFFELLLDPSMMYSSAIFASPGTSLTEAQLEKVDRLCRRLGLGPDDHVLEIGSGWGGFAAHAASTYGCRVTTTTISDQQEAYARARIEAAGLTDLVTVLNCDYRDLEGSYDAIVSIEMIEAVDWREYPTFFATVGRLLGPNGRVGMQAIVIPGQRYERAKNTEDFIKAFIFPGSYLPSLTALTAAAEKTTDLTLVNLEDIGQHYAETLRRWRERVEHGADELPAMGLDERFLRMWRFYLCYCEAGFDDREISDVQLVFARRAWVPTTLDA